MQIELKFKLMIPRGLPRRCPRLEDSPRCIFHNLSLCSILRDPIYGVDLVKEYVWIRNAVSDRKDSLKKKKIFFFYSSKKLSEKKYSLKNTLSKWEKVWKMHVRKDKNLQKGEKRHLCSKWNVYPYIPRGNYIKPVYENQNEAQFSPSSLFS